MSSSPKPLNKDNSDQKKATIDVIYDKLASIFGGSSDNQPYKK